MIITCNNCNKKFDIDSNLIPDKGRLLQCVGCNHKWFFKKDILKDIVIPIIDNNDDVSAPVKKNSTKNEEIDASNQQNVEIAVNIKEKLKKKIMVDEDDEISAKNKPKNQTNFKILNIFLVGIISFITFIIFIDTFKYPIGKVVPNIEFILYNLYESIKDISLFIKDLN